MPDIPTFEEAGYPDFEASAWNALLAPAGTPSELVKRLNTAAVAIIQTPAVREKLAAMGAEQVGDSPEQFGEYLRAEVQKWAKVVELSGAKLE
jgi:tripartite-type tricarboxylate transporter receptor subunit TctC